MSNTAPLPLASSAFDSVLPTPSDTVLDTALDIAPDAAPAIAPDTGPDTGPDTRPVAGTQSASTSTHRQAPTPGSSGMQNDLFQRVVQGAHQTVDSLAATAAPHLQRLQEGMSSAADALPQNVESMRKFGDEWTETLRTTVRENPLAALATAVAVGLLISRLTGAAESEL